MSSKMKKMILIVLAVVILLSAGGGAWYWLAQKNAEPVYVFPFSYVGMTEYWGDSQESYGPVSTDKIQTIYLSDTQTVTEILVKQGQSVKKGDLLMSFDTTLSDLALERKRLDVEKLKLQLTDAQKRLKEIKSMKPMVIPKDEPQVNENLGTALKGTYQISTDHNYDGSKKSLPLICWISERVCWMAAPLLHRNPVISANAPSKMSDPRFTVKQNPVKRENTMQTTAKAVILTPLNWNAVTMAPAVP